MLRFASITLAVCLAAGCATSGGRHHWARTGDPVIDGKAAIAEGPEKDRVLWQYRTALVMLRRGMYDEGKALLDDALLSVNRLTAGDRSARRARGYFSEEATKNFRGEPYERAMAFYYRGILYWMDGEPDNARACFRSAQFHDSDTENREYAGDYVLCDYLDGLVSAKLGGDGSDELERARALNKGSPLPDYNPRVNAMFFVEYGKGPTKFATGEYGEELRFRTYVSQVRSARLRIGSEVVPLPPYDDLNFQATTRGGRVMDHILANKAVFKSATSAVGDVGILGGAVAAHAGQNEAAIGLLAFGLLSKIVSSAATPRADTRDWDNLPQYLSFGALELSPGAYAATVEFLDPSGNAVSSLNKTVNFTVVSGRDTVIFVSDRSQTSSSP